MLKDKRVLKPLLLIPARLNLCEFIQLPDVNVQKKYRTLLLFQSAILDNIKQ